MPDENGTETARPDAVNAEESIFGDTGENAGDTPAEAVEEQDSEGDTEQDTQGAAEDGDKPDDAEPADAETQDSEESAAVNEAAPSEELKVVVSIKGGRAVIGVQQPSSDPHIETFEDADLSELAQEVTAVTERARARWEENPKHPAYERPAPPPKRRNNRRQQGAATNANAEGAAGHEEAQQTLRLF